MSLKTIVHDTLGKVLVTLATGFVLAVSGALAAWPLGLYSSIVMADELEPIAEAIKGLADQQAAAAEQQARATDEWRCSELEEELQGYYDRQEAGQAYTQRDIDRMERIKERMGVENLNCVRFED